MRKLIAYLLLLAPFSRSYAQDFSNKGKDFYLCFPQHVPNSSANLATLSLYITSDKASKGTITMANGAFTGSFNIAANGIQEIQIPWNANIHISNGESNTVINKSIRIKTDLGEPAVVAYAQQWAGARSAATLLLPVNVLGKKYYAVSFTQSGANQGSFLARSQFQIIAVKNNTVVTITPRKNGVVQAPVTITLPLAGDMYQYQSTDGNAPTQDLTGTVIESVASGSGGCLPIAVFSGSSNVTMGSAGCTTGNSYDPLFQQLYPASTWGKNFGFIPFEGYPNGNPVRVMASENNTNVYFNGSLVATLNEGDIYPNGFTQFPPLVSAPTNITSDKPVCVAQYVQRNACSGRGSLLGDPDMVVLNPIEQNINDIIVFSSTRQAITEQWVNVLLKTVAIPSFSINGNTPPAAAWSPMATLPGYSYIRYSLVGIPSARIVADSGFNAIAYGWGSNESYAYSAGTNVKDIYQQIGVSSQYGIETTPSVCTGTPFKFKVSLPYLADSIRWNLSNLPGNPGTVLQAYSNPPQPSDADSITIVNGRSIYWYSLPTFYSFATTGQFPVSISVFAPNVDGCGNEQLIDFELEISNPPVGDFTWVHDGCINSTVQFNDNTTSTKPVYRWSWNFGDPASGAANTSTIQNPVHNFSAPGTYQVTYSSISTAGCLSDTIRKQIVINPLPTANITGDVSVCQGTPQPNVTFNGVVGTAPFTFTYNINNGANQTITTSTGNSINLPVSTTTPGTFTYYLVSVKDAAGTAGCSQNQPDTVFMNVRPVPTATISGNASVCVNDPSPVVTFTGAGSIAPYTFTYQVNGGANQFITTTTGNSITLPVATGTANSFVYTLISVADGNTSSCSQAQPGNVTVTINPLPTASLSPASQVCLNGASQIVTFTGANGTAPYTFTYKLNGGPNQTITSAGNTATITVPATVAGTFTYLLVSVQGAGTPACSQLQSGSTTITVNPLPVAAFTSSATGCINKTINFTDNSTPGAGTINSWAWNFGDPGSGAANTATTQNPTHTYNTTGVYNVTLTVGTDRGCNSVVLQKSITIFELPKAGFVLPEVCLLDPFAQFTDTSKVPAPQTINGWLWNFGDPGSGANNTSTVQNAQHTYPAVGNYNVQLIVSSNNGCTDTLMQVLTVNGGNPVADFAAVTPPNFCGNDSITIQNKSTIGSGNITKVEIYWDNVNSPTLFDTDDFPVFNKLYRHKYPDFQTPLTRTYSIRYRAYSGGVCVSDRISNITVNASPKVAFAVIPNSCLNVAPFQVTQATETGGVPGSFGFSGPGINAGGVFNPAVVGPGTYTIKYKYTSNQGCVDSAQQTITVLRAPVADFTTVAPACESKQVIFRDASSSQDGTITTWTWNFGDGTAPVILNTNADVPHTFANAGNYTVSLTVTTNNGCNSLIRQSPVVIAPLPRPAFSFPASVCLPAATVNFTNNSTIADGTQNSFTYSWDFGDPASGTNNTSTAISPTHVYTGAGPYSVKLSVTSGAGCTRDTTILVDIIHPQPKADFDFSRPSICVGDDLGFIDKSTGADGTVNGWNWSFGDGGSSLIQNPTHLYGAAGNFAVKLFVTNSRGCNSDTVTKQFVVYSYPVVNAGPDRFVLENGSVTLEPSVTGANLNFLWQPATYLNNDKIERPVSSPLADITYTLTVTNPGGCTGSDMVFVKVLKGPKIPNTFTPNGDGINETWRIEYLDTYPENRVQVFTRTGQLVFESRGYKTPWDGTARGRSLPSDTYYYIIEPGNGRKPLTGYVTILK